MNRREALRSLAGGMVAGALAAGGIALAAPVKPTALTSSRKELDELVERCTAILRRMDDPTRTAHLAVMRALVDGSDPAAEVYEAVGRERGVSVLASWGFAP